MARQKKRRKEKEAPEVEAAGKKFFKQKHVREAGARGFTQTHVRNEIWRSLKVVCAICEDKTKGVADTTPNEFYCYPCILVGEDVPEEDFPAAFKAQKKPKPQAGGIINRNTLEQLSTEEMKKLNLVQAEHDRPRCVKSFCKAQTEKTFIANQAAEIGARFSLACTCVTTRMTAHA